jgi:hypothetical protein
MSHRVPRVIPFLLLGATACGDASLTASSNFPREGEDDRGATVRVVAEDAPQTSEPETGHR